MRYALTKTVTSQQEQFIRDYGDALWEWVCNTFPTGFTIGEITLWPGFGHLAFRTRLDACRAIVHNVIAEYENEPEKCPLIRRGRGFYWK